ncbi:hypothetical protein NDU88_005098, partial [Pleurodeles waltl]
MHGAQSSDEAWNDGRVRVRLTYHWMRGMMRLLAPHTWTRLYFALPREFAVFCLGIFSVTATRAPCPEGVHHVAMAQALWRSVNSENGLPPSDTPEGLGVVPGSSACSLWGLACRRTGPTARCSRRLSYSTGFTAVPLGVSFVELDAVPVF